MNEEKTLATIVRLQRSVNTRFDSLEKRISQTEEIQQAQGRDLETLFDQVNGRPIEHNTEKLMAMTKTLWQANRQISEIRSLTKELIQTNNNLVWQLYSLAGQYGRTDKPDEEG